jgi:uncharacterized LabA/DUF88 family protein
MSCINPQRLREYPVDVEDVFYGDMHKVAIFIDGGYLDKVLDPLRHSRRVGYHTLIANLVAKAGGDREIIRIYYYHCLPYQGNPPTPEQSLKLGNAQRFFRALQRTPRFEVRLGRLEYRGNNSAGIPIYEQKRVDLLLGIDLTLHAAKGTVDEMFIVAGDSDFIPAICAAKSEGIITYLIHGANPHDDLLDEVDERIEITQIDVDNAVISHP